MPRPRSTLRLIAALTLAFSVLPQSVLAADAPDAATERYAAVLRTINPHLQVHQSLAFARSILVTAERNDLDPELLTALVTVESGWRPNAVSWAGARGLGQLMPSTARNLHVNPFDPSQNLHGAGAYLRAMLDRFADRGRDALRYAIGAYNAGPKAVEKYRGIPPYSETRNYVRKVLTMYQKLNGRIGSGTVAKRSPDEQQWLGNADASALAVTASR